MHFGNNTKIAHRIVLAAAAMVLLGAQDTAGPGVELTKPQAVARPHATRPATAPAQAAPANPSSPITGSHTIGSWTVRCYRTPGSVCDISQVAFERRRNLRVLGIAIAYVPTRNVFTGQFAVPLGVSFAKGMTIRVGTFSISNLKYRRCERDGCYVEGVLPGALIDAMTQSGESKGSIDIEAINGAKLSLPIVLDGFRDGLVLLKQVDSQQSAPAKP